VKCHKTDVLRIAPAFVAEDNRCKVSYFKSGKMNVKRENIRNTTNEIGNEEPAMFSFCRKL